MSTGHLAHHFDTPTQQYRAATLGMWLFLATEVLFFGGLFGGYTAYRFVYPEAFVEGSSHLSVPLGTFNTAVLLASSLCIALAVHDTQTNGKRNAQYILCTFLLGALFLAVKAYEYYHKWHEGLVPGLAFHPEESMMPQATLFLSFYFAMTGLHATHMIVGLGLLTWIWRMAKNNEVNSQYGTPVEMVGLYWHFVDIVWVFLFPLLYLIG